MIDQRQTPVVELLIRRYKKLEAARTCIMIRGGHTLRFDSNGKIIDEVYSTNDFEPAGEWKNAAEYLELENEFHSLLFSDLTFVQMGIYRA